MGKYGFRMLQDCHMVISSTCQSEQTHCLNTITSNGIVLINLVINCDLIGTMLAVRAA